MGTARAMSRGRRQPREEQKEDQHREARPVEQSAAEVVDTSAEDGRLVVVEVGSADRDTGHADR